MPFLYHLLFSPLRFKLHHFIIPALNFTITNFTPTINLLILLNFHHPILIIRDPSLILLDFLIIIHPHIHLSYHRHVSTVAMKLIISIL